jgi:hypothetical protein
MAFLGGESQYLQSCSRFHCLSPNLTLLAPTNLSIGGGQQAADEEEEKPNTSSPISPLGVADM